MKKQITSTKFAYYAFPKLAALVTVRGKDKPNIITLAWHSPLSFKPPLYGISVAPSRYSHDLILQAKEYAVNFVEYKYVDQLHYCGRHSGREVNKFERGLFTAVKALKIKAPLIKEAYSWLECKLVDSATYGDHTWFVGEVIAVQADEEKWNQVLGEGVKPIYYLGANRYTTLSKERRAFS